MIQDSEGRLYLLTYYQDRSPNEAIAVYAALDEVGTEWADPVHLTVGHRIQYSGMTLAAPRGGTANADFVDGVFPAGDRTDNKWVAFRIRLR
jgi:hypothetical protein